MHQDSGSHFLLHQIRSPTAAATTPARASLPLMSDVDRITTINSEKKEGKSRLRSVPCVFSSDTDLCVSEICTSHLCVTPPMSDEVNE